MKTTNPAEAQYLVANGPNDRIQVMENESGEYSYACRKDVTELIQQFCNPGTQTTTFTVGNIDANTDDQWAYLGWSLVIVYESSETLGHMLYLFDDFEYIPNQGQAEYDCSGFLVPEQMAGEVNAAQITSMVGEGDPWYDGDHMELNDTRIYSREDYNDSNWNNTWNSDSEMCSNEGIDIDTFDIPWSSGLLNEGDVTAKVTVHGGNPYDILNVVYTIMAFRSESNTGGALTYLIHH